MGESVCKSDAKAVNATERNISLDILRVLCMFLIVLGHSICHSGITEELGQGSLNYYIVITVNTFLMVHVNCFVLISGYFLCKQEFRLKKALLLWTQTFFWSALIYLISCASGYTGFSVKELAKSLLPFTQQRYWFVTTYLLMYFLVPLLNAAIRAMDKKQHATFLLIYFSVYTVLQNLVFWREFSAVNSRSPLFFAFLYLIAAYFRLYPAKKRHWLLGYIMLCSFVTIWELFMSAITIPVIGSVAGAFSSYNSVTIVLASVCLFKVFEEKKITNIRLGKLITTLSAVTFGIYLIHDNNECRRFLWSTLLAPARYADNPALIIILIAMSIGVFAGCGVLEYCRMKLFRLLKIDKLSGFVSQKMERIGGWILRKVFEVE